jgi:hypothetical protein
MAIDPNVMFMVLHLGGGIQAYDYVDGDRCRNAQVRIEQGHKLSITIQAADKDGGDKTHDILDIECRRITPGGLLEHDKDRESKKR